MPGQNSRKKNQVTSKMSTLSIRTNNNGPVETRPRSPPPPRPLRAKPRVERPASETIPVKVNHFKVNCLKKLEKIVHYDIVIESNRTQRPARSGVNGREQEESYSPAVPDRFLPLIWVRFMQQFRKQLGMVIPFDGKKNAYATRSLDFGNKTSKTYTVLMPDPDDHEKERVYDITLQQTGSKFTVESFQIQ